MAANDNDDSMPRAVQEQILLELTFLREQVGALVSFLQRRQQRDYELARKRATQTDHPFIKKHKPTLDEIREAEARYEERMLKAARGRK